MEARRVLGPYRRWRRDKSWAAAATLHPFVSSLKTGDVVLDFGANTGQFAAVAASRGSRVFCWEPHPAAFARLQRRFRRSTRVTCFNRAIGLVEESREIFVPASQPAGELYATAGSSLVPAKRGLVPSGIVVTCDALEAVLDAYAPITLVKMDIEGLELDLLPVLRANRTLFQAAVVEMHEAKMIPGYQRSLDTERELDWARKDSKISLDWH